MPLRMILTLIVMNLSAAPGLAQSVGVNFVGVKPDSSTLDASDKAGATGVEQANWNNLAVDKGDPNGRKNSGYLLRLRDSQGDKVPNMTVVVDNGNGDQVWPARGAEWGFSGSNLTLQHGLVHPGPAVTLADVPYERYDVYVYVSAGDNRGHGSASIEPAEGAKGEVAKDNTFFIKYGWTDGRFVVTAAKTKDEAKAGKPANLIVFKGNTARDVVVRFNGRVGGGWVGVSAIQIVKAD